MWKLIDSWIAGCVFFAVAHHSLSAAINTRRPVPPYVALRMRRACVSELRADGKLSLCRVYIKILLSYGIRSYHMEATGKKRFLRHFISEF